MTYLNTPGLEKLFPQAEKDPPQSESFLVAPPDLFETARSNEVNGGVTWGVMEDFPRDKEKIAQARDWILQDEDKRWAPGPGDYSPYKEGFTSDHIKDVYEQLRKSVDIKPSTWVPVAMAELERTGARKAIPSGFHENKLWFPDKDGTIYVGLPNE